MSEKPLDEEALFHAARRIADLAARALFIDQACGDNAVLAERVRVLLKMHDHEEESAEAPLTRTAAFEPVEERPGSRIGPYVLREQIGEGGFGLVFVAEQQQPVKRKVALKIIKPGMDSRQVITRFEAERQALALMDHPNIAKVLDAGSTDSGRPYFVMELVRGIPITEYCDQNQLTPKERLDLFISVCHAIQHAHQKGIIHRDIKPSNVLVTSHDGKPVAKVIDFGVAKAIHQQLTEHTIYTNFAQMIGTPLYMSPEQAEMSGLDIDTRSDIYSLGVLLYELLTGSTPLEKKRFAKAAYDEIRRLIREEEPPKPSQRLSTSATLPSLAASRKTEPAKLSKLMRGDLDWITMKALEKDRTRRYETANGLARDIQRYLADEVVEARPASAAYRLRKFSKKNRTALTTAAVIALLLVGGVAVSLWQAVRARAAERAALEARQAETERAEGEKQAKQDALAAAAAEKAARDRESAQRARAEKASDRTRQVLDAMVSGVTGDSLSTQKEITAEQKKFLTEVLSYYREFAGEKADDEKTRARTANAAFRVGLIEDRLGRKAKAVAALQMACDGYQKLADDFPAVPHYRRQLANSRNSLGNLLVRLEQRTEAEEQYRKALAIREKLAADFPAVPDYRRDLASSHHNLALLLTGLGKRAEAEGQFRKALAIREKLAADFPATPGYRWELASSHHNLGILLAKLGKRAEGEEQRRVAMAIREKLAAEFPAVPEYRLDLARSYNSLGILLAAQGKRAEAEEQYRRALAIRERLAADFPAVPDYRVDVARNHYNLGILLAGVGQRREAEEQYRQALAIEEKLTADFPVVPDYRQELARSHNKLGFLLLADLGKRAEAEGQYRRAIAIYEKLAADFPAVPEYRVELGGSYCDFGDVVRGGERPAESLAWFQKAIDALGPVHEKEPRDVRAKQVLRNSHWGRARAHERLQKYVEAVKDWDRAIELSEQPDLPRLRTSRAITKLRAGQAAEAVAEVAELTKLPNWNFGQWYDFACVYAVASGKLVDKKAEYGDRAMDLLQKAVKAGYKDAAHMAKDTDLDSLRGREDFKKLLGGLGGKQPPKP